MSLFVVSWPILGRPPRCALVYLTPTPAPKGGGCPGGAGWDYFGHGWDRSGVVSRGRHRYCSGRTATIDAQTMRTAVQQGGIHDIATRQHGSLGARCNPGDGRHRRVRPGQDIRTAAVALGAAVASAAEGAG